MKSKSIVQWAVASVGMLSLAILGCAKAPDVEAETQAQTYTTPTAPPASSNSNPQAPTRTPDVVYVPTPEAVVNEMLRVANVTSNDLVYDLGSGDGRIVIAAARDRGARGIGIDIDPARIREANDNAQKAGVADRVAFRQQDLFTTDLSDASVVTLYLLSDLNVKLRPKLLRELKPGTRVVSHAFDMGEWKPEKVLQVDGRTIYYWVVPENPPANLL